MNGEMRLDQQTRVGLLAVLAVAVAVIAFLLISGGDDDEGEGAAAATIVSADELKEIAEDAERPIYWAGERPGTRLEYERTEDGLIYVRYLTDEAGVGDPSTSFLTIGTYRVGDAVEGLEKVERRPNTVRHDLPGGGLVVVNTEHPSSAYVAYPGAEEQVEVYDPDPKEAIRVATSGEVVPIN
jgi:hypothetical protein